MREKKSVVEKEGRGRKGSRVGPVSPGVNARLCDHSRMHWFFLSFPLAKLVYTESGGEGRRGGEGSPWPERRGERREERRQGSLSVSTADLIGFIRGKCVRPRPCNPFFTLPRLNRMPSRAPLSLPLSLSFSSRKGLGEYTDYRHEAHRVS